MRSIHSTAVLFQVNGERKSLYPAQEGELPEGVHGQEELQSVRPPSANRELGIYAMPLWGY